LAGGRDPYTTTSFVSPILGFVGSSIPHSQVEKVLEGVY